MHRAVAIAQSAPDLERPGDERESTGDDVRVERSLHDGGSPVVVVGESDADSELGERRRQVGHIRVDGDRE